MISFPKQRTQCLLLLLRFPLLLPSLFPLLLSSLFPPFTISKEMLLFRSFQRRNFACRLSLNPSPSSSFPNCVWDCLRSQRQRQCLLLSSLTRWTKQIIHPIGRPILNPNASSGGGPILNPNASSGGALHHKFKFQKF